MGQAGKRRRPPPRHIRQGSLARLLETAGGPSRVDQIGLSAEERDMAIAALESAVLSGPDRKGKFMAARGQRTLTEAELKACGNEGRRPRGGSMARGTLFRKRRLPRRADMQWVDVRAAIVRNVTCVAIRGCAGKLSLRAALVALATIYERVHAREGKPRSPV